MNVVGLVGRLTKDPELKYTPAGVPFVRATVAVNRPFQNQQGEKEADFISVVAWRKQAENLANFMRKGSQVGITGRIQTGSYDGQDGKKVYTTDVVADAIQFLDPSTNGGASAGQGQPNQQYGGQPQQNAGQGQPNQQYGGQPQQNAGQGQPNQQYVAPGQPNQQYAAQGQQNFDPAQQGQPNQQYAAPGQTNQQYAAQGQPNQQYAAPGQTNQQYAAQGQPNQQYVAPGQQNQQFGNGPIVVSEDDLPF